MPLSLPYRLLIVGLLIFSLAARSQSYLVRGVVYDSSRNYPLEAVSVLSTSGTGAITNGEGFYEIRVTEKDSIWFSYLNKPTIKFPVIKIGNPMQFDISLQVSVPVLREVKVFPRNYKLDSIRNRQDYAKVFNYRKPGLRLVTPSSGAGVGFDVNAVDSSYENRGSLGMINLRERTELVSGVLRIDSARGRGTRVQIVIPLTEEAAEKIRRG